MWHCQSLLTQSILFNPEKIINIILFVSARTAPTVTTKNFCELYDIVRSCNAEPQ